MGLNSLHRFALAAAIFVPAVTGVHAQGGATPPPPAGSFQDGMGLESRASLTARMQQLQSQGKSAEAAAIRRRLEQGDFPDGSRIYVAVDHTVASRMDTLIVRGGGVVNVPVGTPPSYNQVSVKGALRSEVADVVTRHIGGFLVNARVRVTPLVRLNVVGSVGLPKMYYFAPDIQIGDALNAAGGMGQAIDPKIVVRRGEFEFWKAEDVNEAVRAGQTLDAMGLQDGDEIFVKTKTPRNWLAISQLVVGLTNLVFAVVRVSR